jgi:hypothetical protein
LHVKPLTGKESENHIGYVISGRMKVRDPSGNETEIEPGFAFEIPPGSDVRIPAKPVNRSDSWRHRFRRMPAGGVGRVTHCR